VHFLRWPGCVSPVLPDSAPINTAVPAIGNPSPNLLRAAQPQPSTDDDVRDCRQRARAWRETLPAGAAHRLVSISPPALLASRLAREPCTDAPRYDRPAGSEGWNFRPPWELRSWNETTAARTTRTPGLTCSALQNLTEQNQTGVGEIRWARWLPRAGTRPFPGANHSWGGCRGPRLVTRSPRRRMRIQLCRATARPRPGAWFQGCSFGLRRTDLARQTK